MDQLKGIFKVRNNQKIVGSGENGIEQKEKKNYHYYSHVYQGWKNDGFQSAKSHGGSPNGLKVCIASICSRYRQLLNSDNFEREKAREPHRIKLLERQAEANKLNTQIERIEESSIPALHQKIDEYKNEIYSIRQNPEAHTGEKSESLGFYIGVGILLFLSVYLFVFYSSASYSAFFKNFDPSQSALTQAIFDAQALSKAWNDGAMELVLILTIPFVFLGLGYLIHKFQEQKSWTKYLKILSLVAVTFLFDALLAYEISHKLYDIAMTKSFEGNEVSFNIRMAVENINFWLIIFAGFVVYLIWGFVFDFVMDGHYKMDKVSLIIKSYKKKIVLAEEKIHNFINQRDELINKLDDTKQEIDRLTKLATNSDIIKPKELNNWINQFLNGWLEWLNSDKREEEDREEAREIVNIYIEENIKLYAIDLHDN